MQLKANHTTDASGEQRNDHFGILLKHNLNWFWLRMIDIRMYGKPPSCTIWRCARKSSTSKTRSPSIVPPEYVSHSKEVSRVPYESIALN